MRHLLTSTVKDVTELLVELDTNSPIEEQTPNIPLNAMNSAAVSGTMRFSRTLNGHPIKILLDEGSDDSFI